MLFAGVLLEGGIIGYDTNTVTGGAGAAFLGIGAHTEYRQDTVTVYLRAVSVRTGEVLTTVTASKTIASKALGASAFKFVAFKKLLEAEAGLHHQRARPSRAPAGDREGGLFAGDGRRRAQAVGVRRSAGGLAAAVALQAGA